MSSVEQRPTEQQKLAEPKYPRQPDREQVMQVPSFRGLGTRDVMGWDVETVKHALSQMASGVFSGAGLLGDDFRLHPVIADCEDVRGSIFTLLPRNYTPGCGHTDDCKRSRCRRARWVRDWFQELQPEIMPDATLKNWHDDRMHMGFGLMGFDWEERRDSGKRYWLPVLKPWHPSQTQYFFKNDPRTVDGGLFHATTLNKGLLEVEPGAGRWALATAATRQPWLRGTVFSLGLDFIGDEFNFFDTLAFQERFGLGLMQYFRDQDYGAGQVNQSTQHIQQTGAGAVIPMRARQGTKMEWLELLQTSGSGWESFKSTDERLLRRILLLYLGQDMTSVGQTGGFKQAVVHNQTLWGKHAESASWFFDGRQVPYKDPNTGYDRIKWEPYSNVLREQITKWICWFNFRDRDLAPYYWLDATPPETQADREKAQAKNASEQAKAIAMIADKMELLQKYLPGVSPQEWFEQAGVLPKLNSKAGKSAAAKPETEED